MKNIYKFILIMTAAFIITACTKDISPNTYDTDTIGQTSRVEPGVIVSIRSVKIDQKSEVGGIAGAGVGAVAGSGIGGSREANVIAAIGGAVLGGLAGDAIESKINQQTGAEYIIKLDNGSVISTTQANKDLTLYEGQHVLVIYGKTTRIVPDTTPSGTFQK